ncbi:sigma-54-dependent transcriptional regulator [Thauera linaloolentis]|uniref:Sigma-54 dependent response regulator n=1 Tax=Thauera linaloolentis (strain DSM 12138 / JCM 21573 / CCUG 41526 / CIP 105981 / IAM 15112 / NBRC 102519 / 47Lol) TaxID=1123367 RepID=N6XVJ8_THAL4|nr:sigma-54 dependent transcriptional regulator [Thauera linaloolentis]ENO85801.1 sigma-54 dependent response regulator [Thauera linaloolentis 47Lol = DSM 12138]MCM8564495.1 sigma-54 dependent transcriptional regulator [Thauera linaloolentis]
MTAPAAAVPSQEGHILIVDDEQGMRSFLARALAMRGYTIELAASAEEGAEKVQHADFDLVILDIALPGKAGIDWLKELKADGFAGDVILITAFADMETAIDALRAGASDFILKPFRIDQIANAIKRCTERTLLSRENYLLRRQVAESARGDDGMIGNSPAIARLRQIVQRLAPMPSTVLIQGESGVGKEVVARALHECSPRAAKPFVPVNCAAISAELIESELFGHVKGAFTGAREARNGLFHYARGGTLFLDEIGELPLALQSRLLRVLEERRVRPLGAETEIPVDVRVLAATNRDLRAEVAACRFREDLFYRLEVVTLTVPPLRERAEDVPELAAAFMNQLSRQLGLLPMLVDAEVSAHLCAHPWPGNVRELRNFIERSLLFGEFPLDSLGGAPARDAAAPRAETHPLPLEAVEKNHILAVLKHCGGNKTRAAELLGVSRKTLERKCAEWAA